MTAPIRDMAGLVEAVRLAQIERNVSYCTIDDLSGVQSGYTAKLLAPKPSKNLGPVSTFPVLGALGKALVLVDDPEQIERVKGRWQKRSVRGAAKIQMRKREAEHASRARIKDDEQETLDLQAKSALSERMKALSKLGASKGGKRRAKIMGKRARQRSASHAARKRWGKK